MRRINLVMVLLVLILAKNAIAHHAPAGGVGGEGEGRWARITDWAEDPPGSDSKPFWAHKIDNVKYKEFGFHRHVFLGRICNLIDPPVLAPGWVESSVEGTEHPLNIEHQKSFEAQEKYFAKPDFDEWGNVLTTREITRANGALCMCPTYISSGCAYSFADFGEGKVGDCDPIMLNGEPQTWFTETASATELWSAGGQDAALTSYGYRLPHGCDLSDRKFCHPITKKFIDEIILRFGTLAEERDWKKSLLDQYVPNKIEEYEQGLIQCSGYDCHWTNGYETLIRTLEMDAFVKDYVQQVSAKARANMISAEEVDKRVQAKLVGLVSEDQVKQRIDEAVKELVSRSVLKQRIAKATGNRMMEDDVGKRIEASILDMIKPEEVESCDESASVGGKLSRDCEWVGVLWQVGRWANECEATGGRWGMNDDAEQGGWECINGG